MKHIRVLVACECSGRVKTAFRERGFDAWSCDLKPSEIPDDKYHIQGDVLPLLTPDWDLLIAHPPCTYLCIRSQYWKQVGNHSQVDEDNALKFFIALDSAPIIRKAIENPIGIIPKKYRNYTQIIEPFMFGDPIRKKTCLWLTNLPLINPTMALWELEKYHHISKSGVKRYWYDSTTSSKTKNRAHKRATTSIAIANAMATQWGDCLESRS